MVYYFTSTVTDPPATIYVGKDKFENEELIKFGWDCDVWVRPSIYHPTPTTLQFHADNISSAHIYLRLTPQQTWDSLPQALLEDCAQLTKANSIEGNKKDNVTIIYTPWSNLHKTSAMATGQVGFHDPRKTKRIHLPTRLPATINRLTKTRTIQSSDELQALKETHLASQRAEKRREAEKKRKEEERGEREKREERRERERAWEELRNGVGEGEGEGGGRSNEVGWDEEDFM